MAFKDKFRAKFNESPFNNGCTRVCGGPNRKGILPSWDRGKRKKGNPRDKSNDRQGGGAILGGMVY